MKPIAILDYGVGNFKSLVNCFNRLGYAAEMTREPSIITRASLLVLPGVGRFETAVTALNASGLLPTLEQRYAQGQPILGICLGMQLLFEGSEESPGYRGLGWLKGQVVSLNPPQDLPLPHIGWNDLLATDYTPKALSKSVGASMYFVHSFVARPQLATTTLLASDYGSRFPALVGDPARGIYGLQCHPEKSGPAGAMLLDSLLAMMQIDKPVKRLAAMDLLDGQVVRLKQGAFDATTRFGEPETLLKALTALDFDGLHIINLNGAKGEPLKNLDVIFRLAASYPKGIQVGGGIRHRQDAERLLFLGCNIIVTTMFFEDYDTFKALCLQYPNRISVSLDIKDRAVMLRGWLQPASDPLTEILYRLRDLPLASLIVTDIFSDGMDQGMRPEFFNEIAKTIHKSLPQVPLVAAGGMPLEPEALRPLALAGYGAAVVGLSLYRYLEAQDA